MKLLSHTRATGVLFPTFAKEHILHIVVRKSTCQIAGQIPRSKHSMVDQSTGKCPRQDTAFNVHLSNGVTMGVQPTLGDAHSGGGQVNHYWPKF